MAPVVLKASGRWRGHGIDDLARNRRWNYLSTVVLPHDLAPVVRNRTRMGRPMPRWRPTMVVRERQLVSPELRRKDGHFREQTKHTGASGAPETITPGYVMSKGRFATSGFFASTSYIAGMRTEKTETEGRYWVPARVPSTATKQPADPAGSAQRDDANNRSGTGASYTKSLPSVHLAQKLGPNLKVRLRWSTSFGRPGVNNFVPNETANENSHTLTINNPGLLPQTASNWDATLGYHFKTVGNVSVGWFHKPTRDFIITGIQSGAVERDPNNGFGGACQGLRILTSANGSAACVQGWEFSFQQQFTSRPGLLRGWGWSPASGS